MKSIIKITTLTIILFMTGCQDKQESNELVSPDGHLSFSIQSVGENLTYTITSGGKIVLEPSVLGIVAKNQDLSKNLQIQSVSPVSPGNAEYSLVSGKQRQISAEYAQCIYSLSSIGGRNLQLEVRAFNDGIAFRYILPDESSDKIHLVSEKTSFNLPQPGNAWMHPYDAVTKYTPGYETYYMDNLKVGDAAPVDKNGWAFPLLFEVNDHWLLISEAGHNGSYPAMHLDVDETGNYSMRLPEPDEAFNTCDATAKNTTPWSLPWRTIMIGDSLADIVENNLVTHVTAANKLNDTSWIKPGRASWSWWSDNDSPKDYQKLKRFVDFAAEMGWEYSLVDANWDEMVGGDLSKLAAYAATRDVGLLVWYNSGGAHNIVTEKPRDRMWDAKVRRAEFQKLQSWGIKGIKVDFFQSDKPAIIRQYIDILEDAADFQILVNFHGCTLPKGWRKTYPNLLTMESVRGGESYIFAKEFPESAPVHLNIATYTRNVVGPMDYTPVGISDLKYPHLTSYAFELAQGVVFESGIQHLSDDPDAYRSLPEYAIDYLKNLPVAWDETKFIDGYPGDYTIIARRKGDTWYVAGINGLDSQMEIDLDLYFISGDATELELISGGETREDLDFTREVSMDKKHTVKINALGGFVGWVNFE